MRNAFKRIISSFLAMATIVVGITGSIVQATEYNYDNSLSIDTDESIIKTTGHFPFNVTSVTNYGKFKPTRSPVIMSFYGCTVVSAKVRFRVGSYTGTEVASVTIPYGIPCSSTNLYLTVGTDCYITIEPTNGYIQAVGSFDLLY